MELAGVEDRRMTMRRALLVLMVIVMFGCGAGPTKRAGSHASGATRPTTRRLTDQERATARCRAAAPHDFVNAQPTTVAQVHATTGASVAIRRFQSMFRGEPANGFVAWCWRMPSPNRYKLILVGPRGEVIDARQAMLGAEPPPGPLAMAGPAIRLPK
jgi:hypothetical protein